MTIATGVVIDDETVPFFVSCARVPVRIVVRAESEA